MAEPKSGERKRVGGYVEDLDEMVRNNPPDTPMSEIADVGLATGDPEIMYPSLGVDRASRVVKRTIAPKPSGSEESPAPQGSPDQK